MLMRHAKKQFRFLRMMLLLHVTDHRKNRRQTCPARDKITRPEAVLAKAEIAKGTA